MAVVDELISRRYNGMKTLLATTNYAPGAPTGNAPPNLATSQKLSQTLGDRVGDRVYSRLLQLVDFLPIEGRDHRAQG